MCLSYPEVSESHDRFCLFVAAAEERGGFCLRFLIILFKMLQFFQRILDWFKSLFWKEEMELTLVGLQYSGKTTFVNVIAVSQQRYFALHPEDANE